MSNTMSNHQRVAFKRTKPNSSIEEILKELYDKIVDKDPQTSYKIEHALESLSKYPLVLSSGKDCAIIQGFNKKLCSYIDSKLSKKRKAPLAEKQPHTSTPSYRNNLLTNEKENAKDVTVQDCEIETISIKPTELLRSQPLCSFKSIPGSRSNAVIQALYTQLQQHPDKEALSSHELVVKAQKLCSLALIKPNVCNDTAWHFLKVLQKQRIIKTEVYDNIEYYSLTKQGIAVGKSIKKESTKAYDGKESTKDVYSESDVQFDGVCHDRMVIDSKLTPPLNKEDKVTNDDALVIDMPPGSYEVVMLIDKNEPPEMFGPKGKPNHNTEPRSLKVGDVAWVARSKIDNQELVLPFLVERKRMDDFGASIKDGRFHEQKFRLRKTGLTVLYWLEDHQGNKRCGLPMSTLTQAVANTRVQEGFLTHHAKSLKGTRKELGMLTGAIAKELQDVHLKGSNTASNGNLMTFESFNSSAAKTKPLTTRELFIKMLLQLRGLSVEKALAITNVYSTPIALMNAYDANSEKDGELLLANLRFSTTTPKVGPAISKTLYKLFTRTQLK